MSILKALIGGLIGAILATVALMYLRDGTLRGYEWFPLVTGLLTGLGARVLTSSAGRSLATGVVAAVISMAAILAGDEVVEMIKLRNLDLGPVAGMESPRVERPAAVTADNAASEATNSDEDDSEDAAAEPVDEEAEAERARAREAEAAARSNVGASGDGVIGNMPPPAGPKTLRDFLPYIFSGLGVLISYQLGRGGASRKTRTHQHEEQVASTSETEDSTDR